MSTDKIDVRHPEAAITNSLRAHWKFFLIAGIVLLIWALSGVLTLTLLLTVFLTVEGVVSIMYAMAHRRETTSRWQMMLLSGIVDLILAGLILAGLPGAAAWAIGLIVGINLLFGGVALTAIALQARSGTATAASRAQ